MLDVTHNLRQEIKHSIQVCCWACQHAEVRTSLQLHVMVIGHVCDIAHRNDNLHELKQEIKHTIQVCCWACVQHCDADAGTCVLSKLCTGC